MSSIGPDGMPPSGIIGPTGDITPEALQKLITDFSTLSKSDQEKFIAMFMAQFPQLQLPQINLNNVDNTIALAESKAVLDLAESWLKSLDEIARRKKEDETSPIYQMWLQSIEPSYRIIQLEKDNLQATLTTGVMNHMRERIQEDPYDPSAVSFMVSAVVVSTGLLGDIANVMNNTSTNQVGNNAIVNDSSFFMEQFPINYQDIAALSVNFFAVPTYYMAKGQVEALGNADKPQNDLLTAQKFASDIIDKVNKNEVGQLLNALVTTKTEGGQKISKQEYSSLVAKAKIVMLAMALGSIYAAQTKWITGSEFQKLLDPGTKLEKDFQLQDQVKQIVTMMNQQLGELSAEDKAGMLTALNNYFNGNPNMKSMLAASKSPAVLPQMITGQAIRS